MNICFYTSYEVSPTQGGTERITSTVAKNLTEIYGCKCYSLFSTKSRNGNATDIFVDSIMIPNPNRHKSLLEDIMNKWNIDVLINQGAFFLSPVFSEVLRDRNASYVFCHHFEPAWELNFLSFNGLLAKWRNTPTGKNFIKACLYPYWRILQKRKLPQEYNISYQLADRVILLSSRFIPKFMKYGRIDNDEKFGVIHNSLSFSSFYDTNQLDEKDKDVLIVSRMEDTPKKISHALKIWSEIERSGEFPEWTLRLVGTGGDLPKYKNIVAYENLKQIVFEGAQPSEDYYKRASVFMMTSQSEGWGLTLTEAQQSGCVPIAFDTYDSLHEIITDNYDGFIVPQGDFDLYVNRMKNLMRNEENRHRMAQSAIESSHRFEQTIIAKQWYDMLRSLEKKNNNKTL